MKHTLALVGLLAGEASTYVIPPPVATVTTLEVGHLSAAAHAAGIAPAQSLLFPPSSMLIADENGNEKLSPAKAKILAAKEAAAAKAAKGGYKPPAEGKAFALNIDLGDSSDKDPFKEANELREKIIDLQSAGKLSKSKSAQLNQLITMEAQARDKANLEVLRAKEKAEREVARVEEKTDGSFASQFSKVTGASLPGF